MSSNWGAPRGNCRLIYRTECKQGTNIRKLTEWLHNETAECLRNGRLVLECPCWGNEKGVIIPAVNRCGYLGRQLQHPCFCDSHTHNLTWVRIPMSITRCIRIILILEYHCDRGYLPLSCRTPSTVQPVHHQRLVWRSSSSSVQIHCICKVSSWLRPKF